MILKLLLLLLSTVVFCSPIASIVIGQDIVDIVTLHPVQPASGLSACPGQNVTINCTIVRMTSLSEAEQPTMTWVYRGIRLIFRDGVLPPTSDPLNNGVYTAVFSYSHNFVTSTATIFNAPLSHNNSNIQCLASFSVPTFETISLAGIFRFYTF